MRLAVVLLVVGTGCSFRIPGAAPTTDAAPDGPTGDGPTDDADAGPDDAPDAAVTAACPVGVASQVGTLRGRVGNDNGGANHPPLACANPMDRMIGVALRMSDQDTVYGGRSAHAFLIACAAVTIQSDGTAAVGTETTYEVAGLGTFDWTPSTPTPFTRCQPGSVINGLRAYRGGGDNRFLAVSIRCTEISTTGTTGTNQVLFVTGSLSETQNPDTVNCSAGEILVQLPNLTGAGFDAVDLHCTTPTCT